MLTYLKTVTGLNGFAANEDGATAIEYGLIAGLVAVAIIVAVTLLGTNLSAGFNSVATKVGTAMPAS